MRSVCNDIKGRRVFFLIYYTVHSPHNSHQLKVIDSPSKRSEVFIPSSEAFIPLSRGFGPLRVPTRPNKFEAQIFPEGLIYLVISPCITRQR